MKYKWNIVVIIYFFVSIIACDPLANDSEAIQYTLQLEFTNAPLIRESTKSVSGTQYIGDFSLVANAYSQLGAIVDFEGETSLNPTSFVLPFGQASIGNGVEEISISPPFGDYEVSQQQEMLNVDFCKPYPYDISGFILPAIYDTFYMRITARARALGTGDGQLWENPYFIVTVPGYTDAEWPDFISPATDDDPEIWHRKYLGENTFHIELTYALVPIYDQYQTQAADIENYMFCSEYTLPGTVFPGLAGHPPYYDTSDYGNILTASVGTNLSMLLFPFEPMNVVGDTVLAFNLDTDGIISVYNRGTPGYKSDDALVLSYGFWNHFDVSFK
jgi:hypothetical protein